MRILTDTTVESLELFENAFRQTAQRLGNSRIDHIATDGPAPQSTSPIFGFFV